MKYLSVLVTFCIIFLGGSVNAQSPTSSGSKSYTCVMKNIDGFGNEIMDHITITGNVLTSENFASTGFKSAKMIEKGATGTSKQYEVSLKSDSQGTVKYDVAITDRTFDGTILVTDSNGKQTTLAVRGMPTTEFEAIQKAKREYQETQKK